MKKTKRLWALLLAMVMALGLISTAFAAPTIDSGRKASLSLYKYDITAASADGAWDAASYVSTGVQDDAVTDKLAQYAILVRLVNSLCAAVGLCFDCLGRGGKEQAMEGKKNLCAPIPLSLHQRLRTEQEQRGQTLSDYITDILREHFEGGARTMNANNRTIAFQVPEELFGRLKDYLARNGLKQKDFILGLIERELNDAEKEE